MRLHQRRKSLADEIGRAAESIALNVSEARQRAASAVAATRGNSPRRQRRGRGAAANGRQIGDDEA